MFELLTSALVPMIHEIVLDGLIRVVLGVNARDLFADVFHSWRKVFENVRLRHVDHSVRVVIENHSVGVQLLNRLQTFRVAVTKLLFIRVFGYCWKL